MIPAQPKKVNLRAVPLIILDFRDDPGGKERLREKKEAGSESQSNC